jgi:phage-related protein
MNSDKKPIIWMGSSQRDLIAMPDGVRKDFGGALHGIQEGRTPDTAKVLKGKAKGALQLSEDYDGETYRTVYTIELEGVVYVLHCFQKKSKSGIATPQADIDLIERRLKDARMLHAKRKDERP